MPIGAQSIKRAARSAGKSQPNGAEGTEKQPQANAMNAAEPAGKEPGKAEAAAEVETETAAVKPSPASAKAAAEAMTDRKPEKPAVAASVIPCVSPAVAERLGLGTSKACRLTEDLPVHLL